MSERKVLVVDDSQFMRMILKDILLSLGNTTVIEAENGDEAIMKYQEYLPDLVTMDLVMPKASGIQGLKGIKSINPGAKVIVVSAIDQQQSISEAKKLGAYDFIIKPFEEASVTVAIKKALAA